MKIVVQRCSRAEVRIGGEVVGKIGLGFVLLVGVTHEDTEKDVEWMAKKVASLRVFEDDERKMNRAITEVGGGILSISQFTLYGDARKGNRPSFVRALGGPEAIKLYDYFNQCLQEEGLQVKTGIFGADMKIALVNDGPVTIWLEGE